MAGRAHDLGQEGFGGEVAVQDRILSALLVVNDELHGDMCRSRPVRLGRTASIAEEVTGIGAEGHDAGLILHRRISFRAVHAVTGIPQPRHNVAVLVEPNVDCRRINVHVRMCLLQRC